MSRQAGFTLLELLISMTLLALLFVLLFGGLRFGLRAWEHGERASDATDDLRLVQALIRREIEGACLRHVAPEQPHDPAPVDFSGTSHTVRFRGPAPRAFGGGDCARITLAIQPDGPDERLVLFVQPQGGDVGATNLLRHLAAGTFTFRGGQTGWQAAWRSQTALPSLLRLRISFPGGDARAWPELFAAPRISGAIDCTYDPATGTCRGT